MKTRDSKKTTTRGTQAVQRTPKTHPNVSPATAPAKSTDLGSVYSVKGISLYPSPTITATQYWEGLKKLLLYCDTCGEHYATIWTSDVGGAELGTCYECAHAEPHLQGVWKNPVQEK